MSDTTDERPSIAELQRIEREDLGPTPQPSLEWWSKGDRGQIAIRNAAPVLLEIAAAAMALHEQERAAAKLRHLLREQYAPKDADYDAVDVADTELARRQSAYDAALAKVRP